mgnify:CR=1 FL=1
MNKVLSPELLVLVSVFCRHMLSGGDRFLNQTVDNILHVWQPGVSIGDDAWYALRLAFLRVLTDLVTPQDGMKVDVDDIYLSRGEVGCTEKGWCSLGDAHRILYKAGLLSKKHMCSEDDEALEKRAELVERYFFRPQDVIGELEYAI